MKLKFGENLRKYRLNAELTQEQLAEVFGVSLQSVSRWESQVKASYPDIELIVAIAQYFGVSVDELLGSSNGENMGIDWSEYFCLKDAKEKYHFLVEQQKKDPDNIDIHWRLCSIVPCMVDDKNVAEKGLRSAKWLLENSSNLVYRTAAEASLLLLCPEEELDACINKYFCSKNPSIARLLLSRYRRRKEYDKYEMIRKDALIYSVEQGLKSFLVVKNEEGRHDDESNTKLLWLQINLYNLMCDVNDPKYKVIGDGEADLWSHSRIKTGFNLAKTYYRMGKTEKADDILLELIGFMEKLWHLPEGTSLTYRSAFLNGIEGQVRFNEINGQRFIEAMHESYFFIENGMWFTPEWYLNSLEEVAKNNPDNATLLSVCNRIKALT